LCIFDIYIKKISVSCLFLCCSTLNGSNGECTNSDDVDTPIVSQIFVEDCCVCFEVTSWKTWCGHTVCEACFSSLAVIQPQGYRSCPICRCKLTRWNNPHILNSHVEDSSDESGSEDGYESGEDVTLYGGDDVEWEDNNGWEANLNQIDEALRQERERRNQVHDFLFSDPDVYCSDDEFELNSDLNGNNGEATNGDDLDNSDRVRLSKECETNRHRNGKGLKKKDGSEPKINKPCREYPNCKYGDTCRFNHIDKPIEVVEEEIKENCYCVFAVKFKNVGKKLEVYGGRTRLLPVDSVHLPEFTTFGRIFQSGNVVISPFLYQFMLAGLRVLPDESRNYAAVNNYVIDTMGIFNSVVLENHIRFYSYQNSQKAVPSSVKSAVMASGISMNSSSVCIEPMVYSPVLTYKYNEGWKILGSKGFGFTVVDGEVVKPPEFLTNKPIVEGDRNKRTYCSLTPRAGFNTYANCSFNVCAALARYFRSRPDERGYRNRQLSLISNIPGVLIRETAKLCEADYNVENRFLVSRPVYKDQKEPKFRNQYDIPLIGGIRHILDRMLDKRSTSMWARKFFEKTMDKFGNCWNYIVENVFSPIYDLYDSFEHLSQFVKLPHPKRFLYTNYVMDEKTFEKILNNLGDVSSKFKWEVGKVGKIGRLYGTLEHLTLVQKTLADRIKCLFKQKVRLDVPNTPKFVAEYSDCQEKSSSDKMFKSVLNMREGECRYIYFSDDGFFVRKLGGILRVFETDISSCDASNGFAVFVMLQYIADKLGYGDGMKLLLAQAARPTKIHNPDNRDEYVRLVNEFFFEYSGLNITTVLNNCASLAIAYGVCQEVEEKPEIDLKVALEQGAWRYGWVLDVQEKGSLNAVTFLKRAFNGSTSWLVYGCIFRSMGSVDGVPTPEAFGLSYQEFRKTTPKEQFEILLRNYINGLYNEPGSRILDALRSRFACSWCKSAGYVSDSDLYERYSVDPWEIDMLVNYIFELKLGDVISCTALEKIFNVDYGTAIIDGDSRIRLLPQGLDRLF
jgi:hypothetical protein